MKQNCKYVINIYKHSRHCIQTYRSKTGSSPWRNMSSSSESSQDTVLAPSEMQLSASFCCSSSLILNTSSKTLSTPKKLFCSRRSMVLYLYITSGQKPFVAENTMQWSDDRLDANDQSAREYVTFTHRFTANLHAQTTQTVSHCNRDLVGYNPYQSKLCWLSIGWLYQTRNKVTQIGTLLSQ